MKISAGWKLVLYAFVVVLLIQGYDLAYYLMNRKDSFLANLGLVTLFAMFAGTLYSLYQMGVNGIEVIKQQIKKEKQL
jgi:hypothetical protein